MAKRDLYIESIIVASNVIVRYRVGNNERTKPNDFDITGYFPQEIIDSLKKNVAELSKGEKENELKKHESDWCNKEFMILPPNPQSILKGIEQKFLEEIKLN